MSVQCNHKTFSIFVRRVVPAYNPSDQVPQKQGTEWMLG